MVKWAEATSPDMKRKHPTTMNQFRSKKQWIYETLREAIFEGKLEPGARIIIEDWAERLGVSHIPIREALLQLEADGFVEIKPYIGARVTPIDTGMIQEIFELLASLEAISSRAACRNMSDEQMAVLESEVRKMDALTDEPAQWPAANIRFHIMIAEYSGTHLVNPFLSKVYDQWQRIRRHYFKDVFEERVRDAQADHWRIFEALKARDEEAVERRIREHLEKAAEAYLSHLEKRGKYSRKS